MRCYDGCPDAELQAIIDDDARAAEELAAIRCRATYFPMEGKWMVFKDLRAITGFHNTRREAANTVLR